MRPACFFGIMLLVPLCAARAEDPRLIRIKDIAPGIIVEMRYAGKDNFTGKKLYPGSECLLCEPAARRLAAVQASLERRGLGLKVWDCYRPLSVQKKLWDLVPDPRYVADPKTGSRHNRGASVDLTLVDKKGRELPMPTKFDEFTERAHRDYMDLPEQVIANRALLEEAMEAEGFVGLPTEWWHFDDPQWMNYALRDEPLGSAALKEDEETAVQLPADVEQLVVVTAQHWSDTVGQLQRFEKRSGQWVRKGRPWGVTLGARGLAWGVGRIGDHDFRRKTEGDLKAPAGLFRIGHAYGYADQPPMKSVWPYQPVTAGWVCVDDPKSDRYNLVFNGAAIKKKTWKSAEKMKRKDDLYKWVLTVEHNFPDIAPNAGSCIFMHVWRRPGSPTEGCTAMAESNMITLLEWLKPEAHPHLLQMPESDWRYYERRWDLP